MSWIGLKNLENFPSLPKLQIVINLYNNIL